MKEHFFQRRWVPNFHQTVKSEHFCGPGPGETVMMKITMALALRKGTAWRGDSHASEDSTTERMVTNGGGTEEERSRVC